MTCVTIDIYLYRKTVRQLFDVCGVKFYQIHRNLSYQILWLINLEMVFPDRCTDKNIQFTHLSDTQTGFNLTEHWSFFYYERVYSTQLI